jgi:hypothetical protein
MDEKFKKYFENINNTYYVAMILDPRFKYKLLNDDEKPNVIKYFRKEYKLYHSELQNNKQEITQKNKKSVYDLLFPEETNIGDEIEIYISEPTIRKDLDILTYWNNNKERYPILSKMARNYLAIPSTSVGCEEMFSKANDLVTNKRNNLSTGIIKKIMCLQSWL